MSATVARISYPRQNPSRAYVRVELEDVRAANDLIIHFDFERDGWVIECPTKMQWEPDEDSFDEHCEEVAFVPAWTPAAEAELGRINTDPLPALRGQGER